LVGYTAGDYGLAGFFYGKLNDEIGRFDAWVFPESGGDDLDAYIATWQGNLKPFGIGGTYELTDIYVNGRKDNGGFMNNINTVYGRVTPVFDLNTAKVKLNLEGAVQNGDAGKDYNKDNKNDKFKGRFFSVGAGATFAEVNWKPSVFVGYDYYSGDNNPNDNNIDAFWSVLPTAHKWLGHADLIWLDNRFYLFNTKFPQQGDPGIKDLYAKFSVKPLAKVALGLDVHYFRSAKDVLDKNTGKKSDNVGWETDLSAKYKYSKNLCFTVGWEHFKPDDAYAGKVKLDSKAPFDHIWFQADLKF
jgi:hypothetical protein